MDHEQRIMSLNVLQMSVGVHVMAGALNDDEAQRIGSVLKEAQARAQREQHEAPRPARVTGGGA